MRGIKDGGISEYKNFEPAVDREIKNKGTYMSDGSRKFWDGFFQQLEENAGKQKTERSLSSLEEGVKKSVRLERAYPTRMIPENDIYGIVEKIKDNGVVERIGKNEFGHTVKEYFLDGKLYARREHLGNHQIVKTDFDDNGNQYLKTVSRLTDNGAKVIRRDLTPNTIITKNNFTAVTDAYGRPVLNKVTDLKLNTNKRMDVSKYRDLSYRINDQGGHLIAHIFGGTSGKENIVPQLDKVNLSKMKRIENMVKDFKNQDYTVDYEIKTNYIGSSMRPSSFEPRIIVNGKEYVDIPQDLKKIYNVENPMAFDKLAITAGEKFGLSHEVGVKSGLVAGGLALISSTVNNVSAYINGDISAGEMPKEILKDTGTATVIGYGTSFARSEVSKIMTNSSNILIKRVGNSCFLGVVVPFAVSSCESILAFAKGKIEAYELVNSLGENAVSVGSAYGGAKVGASVGEALGPAGVLAGSLIGGIIGCVIASEIYSTAIEAGSKDTGLIAKQIEKLAQGTIKIVKETIPDKVDEVKLAFDEYFAENNVPISI